MCKVLVVENNPTILRLLSYHLEREGCDVLTAVDGLAALVILDKETPDIIFTDIIMPKISGDQLCEILRKNSVLKDIFIAVYSSTAVEDNRQILEIDADVYIAKSSEVHLKKHIRYVLQLYNDGTRRVQQIIGGESLHSRAITKELLLARKHYHAIFNNMEEAVVELDSRGLIVQANKAAHRLFNYDSISFYSENLMNHVSGPETNDAKTWIHQGMQSEFSSFKSSYDNPLMVNNRKVLLKMVFVEEHTEHFIICIFQDITKQKKTEEELGRTLDGFNALLDSIDYGVLLMDSNLVIRDANQAYRDMWGIPASFINSTPTMRELMEYNRFNDIYDYSQLTFDQYFDEREKPVRKGAIAPMEMRLSDGRVYRFKCDVLPGDGRMLTYFDITSLKQTEDKLAKALGKVKKLANHDPLTGLPNLRLGQERLLTAISLSKRKGLKAAILFIDLDGFKEVNDSHGHSVGDKLLLKVANRLIGCLRESDTVARIGGDEFLIILNEVAQHAAAANVAEKIVVEISKPFSLEGRGIRIGASIGISIYPDNGEDSRVLLKLADDAMYYTKRAGKSNYTFAPKVTEMLS